MGALMLNPSGTNIAPCLGISQRKSCILTRFMGAGNEQKLCLKNTPRGGGTAKRVPEATVIPGFVHPLDAAHSRLSYRSQPIRLNCPLEKLAYTKAALAR